MEKEKSRGALVFDKATPTLELELEGSEADQLLFFNFRVFIKE